MRIRRPFPDSCNVQGRRSSPRSEDPHRTGTVIRTSPHRPTALLAALVFLLTWTGDVFGQHPCPHHSSVPGAAAHASMNHDGHADHAAPAEHAGHGDHGEAAASDDHHGSESGQDHAVCTCLGSCPSAAGGALPADADAGLRVAPAWVRDVRPDAAQSVLPRLLPFFLPYAQAPPALG